MPYILRQFGPFGWKVCKRDDPDKCFSNKFFKTKKEAMAQLRAINISEFSKKKKKK